MSKDTIRARAFASRNLRTKLVTVEMDGTPTEVEIAQPTIKQRRVLIETGCLKPDKQPDLIPALAMKRQAVVFCARDPESHQPLFDAKTDAELLDGQGAGGWMDTLADVALSMMQEDDKVASEQTAKNSAATL